MRIISFVFGFLLATASTVVGDTLVVCPTEFREALVPWVSYREAQGHEITIIPPRDTASGMRSAIRQAARDVDLKYLLIVGDVATPPNDALSSLDRCVPTNYIKAKVNTRWGSETRIATDVPYGDLNDDGIPELAVGRIPADTADELLAVVRKIIRYEQEAEPGDWQQRLELVAGVGGFGLIADTLIEAVAQQIFSHTVPSDFEIFQTSANPKSPHCPAPGKFSTHVRDRINAGCFAWVYMGHGLSTELDRVRTPLGEEPIMTVADVSQIQCGAHTPLAVMIACYTGAFDAYSDCLGERLLLEEEGPVAVIAATRVSMPYGNTVLGYELLRACFGDSASRLGDILRTAQQRTLATAPPDDALRASFDTLAQALSPRPIDLEAERREHVSMYQLFGDPLVQLRRPMEQIATAATDDGERLK